MDKLILLLSLLGALFGCDGGRDDVVHRVVVAGHDVMLSRTSIRGDEVQLDCVRGASGACHYVLLPRGCATVAACGHHATRYDVAAGASRRITQPRGFRLCVITRPGDPPQCSASDRLGG